MNSTGSTLWTLDGIAVCTALYGQANPQINIDAANGVIITWQDYRSTTSTPVRGADIYTQRLDSNGIALWATNGVVICTTNFNQVSPQISKDNAGGAIIAWTDYRNSTTGSPSFGTDIFAQRVNSNGSTLWTNNGVPVISSAYDQTNPSMIADGTGGVIIVWQDYGDIQSNVLAGANLYAQRLNSSGIQQWQSSGKLVCTADYDQLSPQLLSDGIGGAIITWYDNRSNNPTQGSDIYAERIFSDGNPIEDFSILPDTKFFIGQAQAAVFKMSDYLGDTTTHWIPFTSSYSHVTVKPNEYVDYQTTTPSNFVGLDTVSYGTNNIGFYNSALKYSTYLMKKLPRAVFSNGTAVENGTINLAQYVSPTAPAIWPVPTIQYNNPADNGKLTAIITSNNLILSASGALVAPASVYVTATPDSTSNDYDREIVRVYEMLNKYGLFNNASDTTQWAMQNPAGTTVQPTNSYLNTYNGATGVLKLAFRTSTQGIKMTLGAGNWQVSSAGQWYTIRMRVTADVNNNTVAPVLYIYNGVAGHPFDVSACQIQSTPTTWTWMETALYCDVNSTLYPQIVIKNGTSIANFYIDALEIIPAKPGVVNSYGSTKLPYDKGDWDSPSDTTGWAFQSLPGTTLAKYTVYNNSIVFTCSTVTSSVKLTGSPSAGLSATSQISTGQSAGMKMGISATGPLTNSFILVAAFGINTPGGLGIKELGATASLSRIPTNHQILTSFIPSQPYIYGQIQLKSNDNVSYSVSNSFLQGDVDSPYLWDYSLLK